MGGQKGSLLPRLLTICQWLSESDDFHKCKVGPQISDTVSYKNTTTRGNGHKDNFSLHQEDIILSKNQNISGDLESQS